MLNPQQFPKPGDTKDIGGVTHSFAGYHMTSDPNFKPDSNFEHPSGNNMEGAEKGGIYVSHDPNYWGRFMGDHAGKRTHAVEAWERVKSPDEIREESPYLSQKTAEGLSRKHVPEIAHLDMMYHGSMNQNVVYPGRDAVIGRTHEFNDALSQHVASYTTTDAHANNLALGPGPRVRQKVRRITEGPEAGKLTVDKWEVQTRAYGGM